MSIDRISNDPPSTDPKVIRSLWRQVTWHTMVPSSASNTAEEPSESGSYSSNELCRDVLREDYGVEVCDLTSNDSAVTTFNPPSGDLKDPYFLINKTEAELIELAEAGAIYISTGASEATCATWIAKLLPLSSKKLVCCNSEALFPRAVPKSIRPNPRSVPWSRMKPGGLWFFTSLALQSITRSTFCEILGGSERRVPVREGLRLQGTGAGGDGRSYCPQRTT